MPLVSFDEIIAAAQRVKAAVMETPVMPSATFSRMSDREVWMKAEILQRGGSFKVRGAMNAISLLDDQQRAAGVVAASAGNHAQGVALAATTLGTASTVFMPEGAALPKIEATQGYGAEVRLEGGNIGEAVDAARAFGRETGARFIHPYDDAAIIAGQGTLGLELAHQIPGPGTVVVPIGGGGLISGVATAIKHASPQTRVIGVEAAATPCYVESRKVGELVEVEPGYTLADGIRVGRPSLIAFEHIESYVDDLVTVDDRAMTEAVVLLLERAKFLVEAAGAAPLAALLAGLVPQAPGPCVLVLTGGNVDLLLIDYVIRHGLEGAGRYASFAVRVPDVPGQLARVSAAIAHHGVNVVSVEHHREGVDLPFKFTEIRFAVETRSREQFQAMCAALETLGIEVLR